MNGTFKKSHSLETDLLKLNLAIALHCTIHLTDKDSGCCLGTP
jgi:hypothetical protein